MNWARGLAGIAAVFVGCGSVDEPPADPDADADVDSDSDTSCDPGDCASATGCVPNGECHPENLETFCEDGAFVTSCGNTACDCGERAGESGCVGDCGCTGDECPRDGSCEPAGTCDGKSICADGEWSSSCGDEACDCDETPETCPEDCQAEWTACAEMGLSGSESCDGICGDAGAGCFTTCSFDGEGDLGGVGWSSGCGGGSAPLYADCTTPFDPGWSAICCCF